MLGGHKIKGNLEQYKIKAFFVFIFQFDRFFLKTRPSNRVVSTEKTSCTSSISPAIFSKN